ncbi:hypothetical protein BJF78_21100 [Pseudonocardia sp. CNS-139]|nr:hypothetical protein BJF78_21100 [Pseudonocardia sp. CNS-139]
MTTTESRLAQDWAVWHAAREAQLATPHGWLSLTALHWLDGTARGYEGLPGTWRATGDGGVELTADGGLALDGVPVTGTVRLEPVDGKPGVPVEVGERRVEVIRRTDDYALRVRDPQALTRTAFTGAPAFPVDERWVVEGRFEPYPEPRRLTVGAVVEGLQHFPTAVGVIRFALGGAEHELVAVRGRDGGFGLHFRDATSGRSTYGGGRNLQVGDAGPDGRLALDLNRTLNLPCAFTAYATCPLPPEGNTLSVAVEAGERTPPRPDLAQP